MRTLVASHMKNIPEPTSGQHPNLSAITFNHHVGCYGCTMIKHINIRWANPSQLAYLQHTLNHAFRLIMRRTRYFSYGNLILICIMVFQNNIGECSTNVYAYSYHWLPPY